MWPRILNFYARALRFPIFSIPTASWLASKMNEQRRDHARTVRASDRADGTTAAADSIPRPESAADKAPPRLIITSTKSAELIKHASNAFLAMKISFINAVASICESVGANVQQVCDGVGTDSSIGPRFLNPGIGYGGSCFPKDLMAFRAVAKESGYDFRLLEEVIRINEEQRHRFLRKVRSVLWTFRGKRLGVLGSRVQGWDRRHSGVSGAAAGAGSGARGLPGLRLRSGGDGASQRGAEIGRRFCSDAYEAATGADALLILTEWEEFASLDLDRLRDAASSIQLCSMGGICMIRKRWSITDSLITAWDVPQR